MGLSGAPARRSGRGYRADDDALAIRRGSAVSRAGASGRAALRARQAAGGDGGSDLPAARWHPAGDRAGGGARRRARRSRHWPARLDDRFNLLAGGRRTALPRHQTLRATLDWSHELLSEPEQMVLRRLAIFGGVFSLEAASTVASSQEINPSEVVDGLSSLIAKSLIAVEIDRTIARYRLLDTTRAYAREKLDQAGELNPVARRLAEYYVKLLQRAGSEWGTRPMSGLAG